VWHREKPMFQAVVTSQFSASIMGGWVRRFLGKRTLLRGFRLVAWE
jgi:hypothetical protein